MPISRMMPKIGGSTILATAVITLILFATLQQPVHACKAIVAVDDSTAGDYNLYLKVRNPTRPGLQVLCLVEEGYEYSYHHPWTGRPMHFQVEHGFIGTTTRGDAPPNITKAGMVLTDNGIAYGDVDILLFHINPIIPNAWDDFDWLRYAYERADNETQAKDMLTKEAVDQLHASMMGEYLFVVGPEEAWLIESDAFHYRTTKVEDVAVRSNYPVDLWEECSLNPYLIAPHFNSTFDGHVKVGDVVRLGRCCLLGVQIMGVEDGYITVRDFPFGFESRKIKADEGKKMGNFWVEYLGLEEGKPRIKMYYKYLEWESRMMEYVNSRYGDITPKDMMDWSRLQSDDLGGLRAVCEGGYEVDTLYVLPKRYPELLSCLWFAPNACCSIYAPAHTCTLDILDPYESGEVHQVVSMLSNRYGSRALMPIFDKPENVFLSENERIERIALALLENDQCDLVPRLLTLSDKMIQTHAFEMEKMMLEITDEDSMGIMDDLWRDDYAASFDGFAEAVQKVEDERIKVLIVDLAKTAAYFKIEEAKLMNEKLAERAMREYEIGLGEIESGDYVDAIARLKNVFENADALLVPIGKGQEISGMAFISRFISGLAALAAVTLKRYYFASLRTLVSLF